MIPKKSRPVALRWLGVAGFELTCDGFKLLIDPYLSRLTLGQLIFFTIRPQAARIKVLVPKADGIVVGHSHFDHVLDVPEIAKQTGARVWGSKSTANLLRAEGVHTDQIIECVGGEEFDVGPFHVRLVPSQHSRFLFGRVPLPGDISTNCRLPLRTADYRCGRVFHISIQVDDLSLYHCGSANLIDEEIDQKHTDLLLMCLSGRRATDDFVLRVLRRLSPSVVLPHHYDDFLTGHDRPERVLPRVAFSRFVDEVYDFDPEIQIITLPVNGGMRIG